MKRYTIYACNNKETVCDGYDEGLADLRRYILDAWTTGVMACFEEFGRERRDESGDHDEDVELRFNSTFANWNGGKFSSYQCGKVIGGQKFGYVSGLVATLEADPPDWLCRLIDRLDAAGASEREDACRELDVLTTNKESELR